MEIIIIESREKLQKLNFSKQMAYGIVELLIKNKTGKSEHSTENKY